MTQPSQADIFAALAAQSSGSFRRSQPSTKTYDAIASASSSSSQSAVEGELTSAESSMQTKTKKNSRRIYCFREGCGSVILSENVGEWITLGGAVLPEDPAAPFPQPPTLPSSDSGDEKPRTPFWHIPSSPFAFDNIGFSRPDASTALPDHAPGSAEGKGKVKWLICAECDLGPIGWSYEGGNEAWVAVERVRYGETR